MTTKDDPVWKPVAAKFTTAVENSTNVFALRKWLQDQPSEEIKMFLENYDWAPGAWQRGVLAETLSLRETTETIMQQAAAQKPIVIYEDRSEEEPDENPLHSPMWADVPRDWCIRHTGTIIAMVIATVIAGWLIYKFGWSG